MCPVQCVFAWYQTNQFIQNNGLISPLATGSLLPDQRAGQTDRRASAAANQDHTNGQLQSRGHVIQFGEIQCQCIADGKRNNS